MLLITVPLAYTCDVTLTQHLQFMITFTSSVIKLPTQTVTITVKDTQSVGNTVAVIDTVTVPITITIIKANAMLEIKITTVVSTEADTQETTQFVKYLNYH